MLEGAAQEYWSSTSRRSLSGRLNVNLKKREKKRKKRRLGCQTVALWRV